MCDLDSANEFYYIYVKSQRNGCKDKGRWSLVAALERGVGCVQAFLHWFIQGVQNFTVDIFLHKEISICVGQTFKFKRYTKAFYSIFEANKSTVKTKPEPKLKQIKI